MSPEVPSTDSQVGHPDLPPDAGGDDLRVLMLTTTMPGTPGDGTPEFVLTLARHVSPGTVRIIAPRVQGCAHDQCFGGVRLRRFGYAPRRLERLADDAILPRLRANPWLLYQVPLLMAGLVRATLAEARRWRPDVLHAHWILPAGLVAALVGRLSGIPYVVTAHGADAYALNGRLGQALKRRVLRGAAGVFPVSSEIAELLDAVSPGCVTRVLPMGVDGDQLRADVGPRRPEQGRLLFVGRLAQKKGLDVLLDALAKVTSSYTLVVAGDGPERLALQRQARNLGLDVDFLGHCSADRVAQEYSRAAALLVPSRTAPNGDRDGTPVVVMEAMAVGIPVVASGIGGILELLSDDPDATLLPEGDAEALRRAIEATLAEWTPNAEDRACRTSNTDARIDATTIGGILAADLSQVSKRLPRSPRASAA